jgi:hypothetical protein
MPNDPHKIIEHNRTLLRDRIESQERQKLLEKLPQGHGSGLDADMVDGLHATELLGKARASGMATGGAGGMAEHGNEFHSPDFASQADLDALGQDLFGIMLPPAGKTITKDEYACNADGDIETLKAYENSTLLFTLAFTYNDDKTLKEIIRTDA